MNIRLRNITHFLALLLTFQSAVFADSPSVPEDVRIAVYSDTAAELFWERSTDNGSVLEYEISFDGEVQETLDATSYFTNTLEPGRRYSVALSAVDDEGNRSTPATLAFTSGDRNPTGAVSPARPDELRALVYSVSAIELFWKRSNTVGLRYEVLIDEQIVSTVEGNSFYIDTLAEGRRYTFTVTAIDTEGRRSEAATIIAETAGMPSSISLPIPVNVSIVRYSSTAAELFWDRPPMQSAVERTEISRDGVVIGSSEGTSYFDDTRASDVHYTYALTFIDTQGNRSRTTELVEQQPQPVINRDNHIAILTEVLPVYTGQRYNTLLIDSVDIIVGQFLTQIEFDFPFEKTCQNGGTAIFVSSALSMSFNACMIGETIYAGNYNFLPGNSDQILSDNLSITTLSDVALEFNGGLQFTRNTDFYRTFSVDVLLTESEGVLSIANANTLFNFAHLGRGGGGSNFVATFQGSFDLRSAATSNNLITISTSNDFFYAEPFETHKDNWNYREGVMQLIATDGSELILDADTNDDDTVSVTLNNSQGTEVFLQPWSLWDSVLRRIP